MVVAQRRSWRPPLRFCVGSSISWTGRTTKLDRLLRLLLLPTLLFVFLTLALHGRNGATTATSSSSSSWSNFSSGSRRRRGSAAIVAVDAAAAAAFQEVGVCHGGQVSLAIRRRQRKCPSPCCPFFSVPAADPSGPRRRRNRRRNLDPTPMDPERSHWRSPTAAFATVNPAGSSSSSSSSAPPSSAFGNRSDDSHSSSPKMDHGGRDDDDTDEAATSGRDGADEETSTTRNATTGTAAANSSASPSSPLPLLHTEADEEETTTTAEAACAAPVPQPTIPLLVSASRTVPIPRKQQQQQPQSASNRTKGPGAWLRWATRTGVVGRGMVVVPVRGTERVVMREDEALGGVPRGDRYSSRCVFCVLWRGRLLLMLWQLFVVVAAAVGLIN
jgi:hypothetical protein